MGDSGVREYWQDKIDVPLVLRELGWRWKEGSNGFLEGSCPFHTDKNPSFSVRRESGYWRCYADTNCGEGQFERVYAQLAGVSEKSAAITLKERFAPEEFERKPAPIPSAEERDRWVKDLWDRPEAEEARQYLANHCCSREVADDCEIGWLNYTIKFPVPDLKGTIVNIKTVKYRPDKKKGAKSKPMAGRSVQAYPLWRFRKDQPVFITEGEPDCWALLSIGLNAITVTGGARSLTWLNLGMVLPTGKGSSVTLCPDNDNTGEQAMQKLAMELKTEHHIEEVRICRVCQSGVKDVAEFLGKIEPGHRRQRWDELLASSIPMTGDFAAINGIFEVGGEIATTSRHGVVSLAPYTAQILESGMLRLGSAPATQRAYKVEVIHRSGRKIVVPHNHGDIWLNSLQNHPQAGPEFSHEKRVDDKVFTFICNRSKDYQRVDSGWIWGWQGTNWHTFHTPEVLFRTEKSVRNNEIRMTPPHPILGNFNLPHPDPSQVRDGVKVLFDYLYRSHNQNVMAPLIINAILAPIRRYVMPNEARWSVYLRGRTGCGKTSRAVVAQAMYGPFTSDQQLLTWGSTPKAVEHIMALAGDAMLVVDDLNRDKMNPREWTDARRVLQGIAQGRGRERMTQNATLQEAPVGYCIPVVTCEVMPLSDASQIARGMILSCEAIDVLDPRWKEPHDQARNNAHLLPYVLSAWIDRVMQEDAPKLIFNKFRERADKAMVQAAKDKAPNWNTYTNAPRIYQRLHAWTLAWYLFLDWLAGENGWLKEEMAKDIIDDWECLVLPSLLEDNLKALGESGIGQDFIDAVMRAIMAGKAKLIDKDTGYHTPSSAHNSAVVIGTIQHADTVKAVDPTSHVNLNGRKVVISLHDGASYLDQEQRPWKYLLTYLRDHEMIQVGSTVDKMGSALRRVPAQRVADAISLLDQKASRLDQTEPRS